MNSYIFVWKPPNIFPDMQNSIKAHLPNSRDGRGSYFFHGAGQGGEGQGQKSTGRGGEGVKICGAGNILRVSAD